MSLGKKIKEARIQAGLSQTEMAERLSVSRQAVTKWENDKGLPDIMNLKSISQLLDVSVDYLLDDEALEVMNLLKQPIQMEKYPKVKWYDWKHVRQDFVVRDFFPEETITQLGWISNYSKGEKRVDWVVGIFGHMFGIPDILNHVKDRGYYYLAERDDIQYLVRVDEEFITTQRLVQAIDSSRTGNEFVIGDKKFIITMQKVK